MRLLKHVRSACSFAASFIRRFTSYVTGHSRALYRGALSLLLILTLLVAQAPAAPQVITGVAVEWRANFAFWYQASGWRETLGNLFSTGQQGAS